MNRHYLLPSDHGDVSICRYAVEAWGAACAKLSLYGGDDDKLSRDSRK